MLALLLTALQGFEPAPPTQFDQVVTLEIDADDPVLEAHGRFEQMEYVSEFSGTLHVWTMVGDGSDLFLRVEGEDGRLLGEDDNSGGGKTPYLKLEVEPGRRLLLCVASSKEPGGDSAGEASLGAEMHVVEPHLFVGLHLIAAPETEASCSAAEWARSELAEVKRLREAKDLDAVRERAAPLVAELLGVAGSEASERIAACAWELGAECYRVGLLEPAQRAVRRVGSHRARTLPDPHPDLQAVRLNLGAIIKALGDLPGARALFEKVVEVLARTLPEDHSDLQRARLNLAATLFALGDVQGARVLEEKVLEVRMRTLPEDHPDLQKARVNLAATLDSLGDLAAARVLKEKAFEALVRTLPGDHSNVQMARHSLATTLFALGDLQGAHVLFEKVLEVRERTLPDEHPDLQVARLGLAATSHELGDLQGARALQEKVLEVFSSTLPDDHPDLQLARQDLATTIKRLGDLAAARALEQKVLEVYARTLRDEDPDLLRARANLAATLLLLGDLAGAHAVQAEVLEALVRVLPEGHPDLLIARQNLAGTLRALGDLAGARVLQEAVLGDATRTLADEHPMLQAARASLAWTLAQSCAPARAAAAEEGDPTEAKGKRARCAELIRAHCRAQVRAAREALLSSSSREAEERCARLAEGIDLALSFAAGLGVFEPIVELERESFVLSETTRGAALGSAELMRGAANTPSYGERRAALRRTSDELAGLAQEGATSEVFQAALRRREEAERELVRLVHELSGGSPAGLEFDLQALAARLAEREALVAFRGYTLWRLEGLSDAAGAPQLRLVPLDSLCAFVLRRAPVVSGYAAPAAAGGPGADARLTRVELGPLAPVEEAVQRWREALGVGAGARGISATASGVTRTEPVEQGERLRRLVFDPLLPALGEVERIRFVLDEFVHLVPLDALPLDGGIAGSARPPELVGERWRIEPRATLTEFMSPRREHAGVGELLAVGGVEYDSPTRSEDEAGVLRGGAWAGGFTDLPGTRVEAHGVAQRYRERFGEQGRVTLLQDEFATRQELLLAAPRARWLHIATHGWFAPDSIPSWSDASALDERSGPVRRLSGEQQVKGMSPMLLCGLAFAGASLPENSLGRVPGLLTAEELSTLDLTNCELAVLSACDTNVGERRAGQGVASLQRALQMAGARSVITSLWKVPDEATQELMLDFYRRLWVEKKSKGQALWEAKMKLRNAKDERDQPRYALRDWAAWVLTGEPD